MTDYQPTDPAITEALDYGCAVAVATEHLNYLQEKGTGLYACMVDLGIDRNIAFREGLIEAIAEAWQKLPSVAGDLG